MSTSPLRPMEPAAAAPLPTPTDCLTGGGEMGKLMRSFDWSRTKLGPVEDWPQSLRTAVSIMLDSSFGMVVAWGPEFIFLYNDRYRPVLGATKHPAALGRPAREIFPEVWDFIGPLFRKAVGGEAVALDDVLIPLDRNGYLEDCYFTLSYSPIRDESGGVGGMLAVVAETTERVLGERRLRILRDLAASAAEAKTPDQACEQAAEVLARSARDVPFTLLYLVEASGQRARRVAAVGISEDETIAPSFIDLAGAEPSKGWPLAEAGRARVALVVPDLPDRFGPLPGTPYPEPAHTALVLPLLRPGQERPYGFLVAGVSPRRAIDDSYRGFFELATEHVATAIANANAHQEERRRAEALAELDRAKTTFFSNVSHEFRTPLALMLGPTEEALARVSRSLSGDNLQMVHRNQLRLLKLVNTLLEFSRIEAGRVDAVYESTDLSALTADLVSAFRSAVEKAGLRLVTDLPSLSQPVFVDRAMWEKIVLNLLSNAFKFTFAGEIAVSLGIAGSMVELRVRDTGVGIAAPELPRLFERFHRVRETRARTVEGTGIGLALVHELVKLHSGSIQVESEPDRGTCFAVRVPLGSGHLPADRISAKRSLAPAALGAAPYVEEALRWLPGPAPEVGEELPVDRPTPVIADATNVKETRARVLIVDDNADMRDYLTRLLGDRWLVEALGDGQRALESALAHAPSLVLSDVMMPGLDGFQLVAALREDQRTATVPIILLSARAGNEAAEEGLAAGANDYLVKPFSGRELIARVQSQLEIARLRGEALQRERDTGRKLADALDRERQARTLADEAVQVRDEFLSVASHELNTPLTPLKLHLASLLASREWSDKARHKLQIADRQVDRLTALVTDLLEVSRITACRLPMNPVRIDVFEAVRGVVEQVAGAEAESPISLAG